MAVVDLNSLGIARLNNRWVISRCGDDLRGSRIGRLARINRLVVLDNEDCVGGVRLAVLRRYGHRNLCVVAGLSVSRRSSRDRSVFVHGGSPTGRKLTDLVGVALGTILDVLGRRNTWFG